MRIHSESVIRHPRDKVFAVYRDRLPEIAPYIPDIREIVVKSRSEIPEGVRLHNEWVAQKEIPAVAQGIIKPDMLRWDDYADWRDAEFCCHWRLKTRVFSDKVSCAGTNRFVEVDARTTKVVLSGELTIDVRDIPGVPRLLAGTVGPQVERFIVALITPNLERVNQSLQRFMDDHRG